MPFLARILATLGGLAVLSAANWVDRYSSWSERAQREVAVKAASEELAVRRQLAVEEQIREAKKPKPIVRDDFGRPEIATKPPFPKVVVENRLFDFGILRVGEQKNHVFRIKNLGQAPLLVNTYPSTGKRSFTRWRREIPIGKAADYEMTWKGFEANRRFAMTDGLATNDPQSPMIYLKVSGKIINPEQAKHDLKTLEIIP